MDWKRVTINTTEEGLDLVGYKLSEIGITQYELVEDAASTQKILDETSAYWDYVDAEAVLAARQPCVRVYLTENAVGEEQLSALRAAVEQVPPDNERWQEYHDLVDAFRYFEPVDPALVAPDSLLREFIGGGSYHYS